MFFYFPVDNNQVAAHHPVFKKWNFKVIKCGFKRVIIKLPPWANAIVNNKKCFGIQIPFGDLAALAIRFYFILLQIIRALSAINSGIVEGEPDCL